MTVSKPRKVLEVLALGLMIVLLSLVIITVGYGLKYFWLSFFG